VTHILVMTEFPPDVLEKIRQAAQGITVHYYPAGEWAEIPAEVLAQTEVLYAGSDLPAPGQLGALKWVQSHSAGVDHWLRHPLFVPVDGQPQAEVQLTTASGVHAVNMSEFILMMMLGLAYHINEAYNMMQRRHWNDQRQLHLPRELGGTTVGLIGYGAIGRQTAAVCRHMGMHVLALRRSIQQEQPGATFYRREQLADFLGRSDFVVLSAPLTEETYHMIDAAALAAMKPTAYLINIARGDLVDEPALIEALRQRRLAGAALDVFAQEPLPDDSPLWQLDNVILTPHIAGTTPNYERRAAEIFVDNIRRFVAGQPLKNKVDFSRGY
jgi:phosphoglycerate dehydrogenase-like enzyme